MGKKSLLKFTGSKTDPLPQQYPSDYMENQRLFVGNLSFETTKEEIITLFSKYGRVDTISLRPNKGFAFVLMSKPEEAMAVIDNLDQTDFKDRLLRVAWELPKKKARKMTRARYKQTAKKHSEAKQSTATND